MTEETGITAGKVWRHLDTIGACKVNTMAKSLKITDKQLQRALGWLERENKISYTVTGRSETVQVVY